MEISQDIIDGLNNMNVYAQRARLGDIILNSGSGSSGEVFLIQKPSYLQFPNIGSENNIYIDIGENTLYRWDKINKKYYMVGANIETIYNNIRVISGGNANG